MFAAFCQERAATVGGRNDHESQYFTARLNRFRIMICAGREHAGSCTSSKRWKAQSSVLAKSQALQR